MRPLILLALVLSGCATNPTQTQTIATGCASASAALRVLTVANDAGKLSLDQQAKILESAQYITPICTAEVAPTLDAQGLISFAAAVAQLQEAAK